MSWLFLAGAILAEVAATRARKVAASGRARWCAPGVGGEAATFVLLSLALDRGMALGVAYGIWAAVGVALTALLSRPLFDEPLTPSMALGIVLIIAGVLAIEVGASH